MISLTDFYSESTYLQIIRTLLPEFQARTERIENHSNRFASVLRLGRDEKLDLDLLTIELAGSTTARVSITVDTFKILKRYASRRAIVAYWNTDEQTWRISLLTASPRIQDGNLTTELSNPRRHSYLLGPGSKIGTATKNLITAGVCRSVEDLENRFALEVVNKEFYTQLAEQFMQLVGATREDKNPRSTRKALLRLPGRHDSLQMHEFGVRLIGRIVFCWFLKQKSGTSGIPLLPDAVFPQNLQGRTNVYSEILQPLFFEVLNKPLNKRGKSFRNIDYDRVPFLNGGLFEPLDGPRGDHYSKTSAEVRIPDQWLIEFFEFLGRYNFTIDENTSIDSELSVDPEMLGRVFENLLAEINPETGESARKATGSFYTPRTVVDYMVDKGITEYLVERTGLSREWLTALVSYDKSDDIILDLQVADRKKIVEALADLRALDPACGSGAFPIGLLQKIVYVLQVIDPECEIWTEVECARVSPEYRRIIKRGLSENGAEYVRKLGVIRRCIYGVDIQAVATEIARLRCFLTLIVDARVNDSLDNRGIEPLPNLEFKFVTANSLLSLSASAAEETQGQLFENTTLLTELQLIRESYFTSDPDDKETIKRDFGRVQANMRRGITLSHTDSSLKYERLSTWQPFDHSSTDWFNSDWMFGVGEFDLILANPPYLGEKGHKEVFQTIKSSSLGAFYAKNMDLFYFFFHLALNLTRERGHVLFITTNYYPTSTYGATLRKDIRERTTPLEFVNFNTLRIFDAAPGQHNLITVLQKGNTEQKCRVVVSRAKGFATAEVLQCVLGGIGPDVGAVLRGSDLFDPANNYIRISAESGNNFEFGESALAKMGASRHTLGRICNVRQGLHANPDKVKPKTLKDYPKLRAEVGDGVFVLQRADGDVFHSSTHARPFFKNSDIKRWVTATKETRRVLYLNDETTPDSLEKAHLQKFRAVLETRREVRKGLRLWHSLHWPREESVFESPKIVCPQRSYLNVFGYNEISWYASADVYFINSNDSPIDLKAILALLNSKAYYYWLYHRGKRKGEMLELYQVPLSEVPIPELDRDTQATLVQLADQAIKSAGEGKSTASIEDVINDLIFKVFEFTAEEIKVIDAAAQLAIGSFANRRDVDDETEDSE
jgi:adenine-specific DNA-methyltransferase